MIDPQEIVNELAFLEQTERNRVASIQDPDEKIVAQYNYYRQRFGSWNRTVQKLYRQKRKAVARLQQRNIFYR
jgi:hypothetical protein